jgi:hypothetical protein
MDVAGVDDSDDLYIVFFSTNSWSSPRSWDFGL